MLKYCVFLKNNDAEDIIEGYYDSLTEAEHNIPDSNKDSYVIITMNKMAADYLMRKKMSKTNRQSHYINRKHHLRCSTVPNKIIVVDCEKNLKEHRTTVDIPTEFYNEPDILAINNIQKTIEKPVIAKHIETKKIESIKKVEPNKNTIRCPSIAELWSSGMYDDLDVEEEKVVTPKYPPLEVKINPVYDKQGQQIIRYSFKYLGMKYEPTISKSLAVLPDDELDKPMFIAGSIYRNKDFSIIIYSSDYTRACKLANEKLLELKKEFSEND